jgi:hypothetical protein
MLPSKGFRVDTTDEIETKDEAPTRPKLSDWVWRPWYAKLWWSAIPLWWAGFWISPRIEPLGDFYISPLGACLGIALHPMAPLLVLGAGFVREWLDASTAVSESTTSDGPPLSDEEAWAAHLAALETHRLATMQNGQFEWMRYGKPSPAFDMYDPRSGGLYIGNPSGINNPARLNSP